MFSRTYPWSNTPIQINSFTIYPMVGATLINPLKQMQDRRLFYYAEPAASQIAAGKSASDYNGYIGVEASDPIASTKTAHATGNFTFLSNESLQFSSNYNSYF